MTVLFVKIKDIGSRAPAPRTGPMRWVYDDTSLHPGMYHTHARVACLATGRVRGRVCGLGLGGRDASR